MAFQNPTPSWQPATDEPNAPLAAYSAFEFLLIELVPMAYRLAAEQAEREQILLGRREAPKIGDSASVETNWAELSEEERAARLAELETQRKRRGAWDKELAAGLGVGGIGGSVRGQEEEETRERVWRRLDAMGYRVGQGLAEKFLRDKPRMTDTLDAVKFLCKDLWGVVFRKQIDNLKTNHRGIYVLTDSRLHPLTKISHERGREEILQQAQPFLYFPAGIIRGALASMGIQATVQAECVELPGASFQIKTLGAKP